MTTKRNGVVISLDFSAQELRMIAERSQDPNMLSCYIGDNKKDMHSITGNGILNKWVARKYPANGFMTDVQWQEVLEHGAWDYQAFVDTLENNPLSKALKNLRALGKKVNFTTEFGAQGPKLAETLLCPVEEAQEYIDAKHAMFARAEEWKREVIERTKLLGYATTLLGARRHLVEQLESKDRYVRSKAERQAVNFEIQGSCAEQSKLARGRIWRSGVLHRYDARYLAPVHDELVFSCAAEQAFDFICEVHPLMIANYAGMRVPIVSSISLGPNFGEQYEVGEEPDQKAIEDVLDKCFGTRILEAA